ncbi:MAG: YidB family protein [Phenylobacterium sp.]
MGLLDSVLGGMGAGGQPQQRPGLGSTVAAGVLLALAVKAVRSYEASHGGGAQSRSFDPQSQAQRAPGGGLGGMLGGLGGMLGGGGGGLGGLLGGLGGAGALGSLINQLQQRGFGQQANSWVQHGENQPISPAQLPQALGEDTIQQLQQQTGMPRDALLTDLAHVLPQAVDEATPHGRLPSDEELHQIARPQPPGQA